MRWDWYWLRRSRPSEGQRSRPNGSDVLAAPLMVIVPIEEPPSVSAAVPVVLLAVSQPARRLFDQKHVNRVEGPVPDAPVTEC